MAKNLIKTTPSYYDHAKGEHIQTRPSSGEESSVTSAISNEFSDSLGQHAKDIKNHEKAIAKQEKQIKTLKNELKDTLGETQKSYNLNIIQFLGIFVAIITFLSASIPIFKGEGSIENSIGLLLVLLGAILSLLMFVHLIVSSFTWSWTNLTVYLFIASVLAGGIYLNGKNKETKSGDLVACWTDQGERLDAREVKSVQSDKVTVRIGEKETKELSRGNCLKIGL